MPLLTEPRTKVLECGIKCTVDCRTIMNAVAVYMFPDVYQEALAGGKCFSAGDDVYPGIFHIHNDDYSEKLSAKPHLVYDVTSREGGRSCGYMVHEFKLLSADLTEFLIQALGVDSEEIEVELGEEKMEALQSILKPGFVFHFSENPQNMNRAFLRSEEGQPVRFFIVQSQTQERADALKICFQELHIIDALDLHQLRTYGRNLRAYAPLDLERAERAKRFNEHAAVRLLSGKYSQRS